MIALKSEHLKNEEKVEAHLAMYTMIDDIELSVVIEALDNIDFFTS